MLIKNGCMSLNFYKNSEIEYIYALSLASIVCARPSMSEARSPIIEDDLTAQFFVKWAFLFIMKLGIYPKKGSDILSTPILTILS